MEQGEIAVGDATIAYRVVRSARRRRTVALKLLAPFAVEVAAPAGMSRAAVHDFVVDRSGWVFRHSTRLAETAPPPERPPWRERTALPFRGRDLPARFHSGQVRAIQVSFDGESFDVTIPDRLDAGDAERTIEGALAGWYARRAADLAGDAVATWAPAVGASPRKVLVRNQRARWGSCAVDGTVRLNWRLVLLTPELFDYVVVHELAHLRQPNHSPAFWAVVAQALPEWRDRRKALRACTASASAIGL